MPRSMADAVTAQRAPAQGPGRLEGEVAATVTDATALVKVIVPNPDGPAQIYGPMRWTAPGDYLPEDGDPALIVQAHNTRDWWAHVWPLANDQP